MIKYTETDNESVYVLLYVFEVDCLSFVMFSLWKQQSDQLSYTQISVHICGKQFSYKFWNTFRFQ